MRKVKPNRSSAPVFETAELTVSGFWCVQVTLPDGDETRVYDFRTKEEARAWIANESVPWLKNYKRGRYV